ncbi:MAG: hypothetical protein Q9197_001309 [Variospora fuerteventurae]
MDTNGMTILDIESKEATSRKGTFAKLVSKLREEENHGKSADPDLKSDDVSLNKYYVSIDIYEGRHRYDPTATWSKEEGQSLILKLDIRGLPLPFTVSDRNLASREGWVVYREGRVTPFLLWQALKDYDMWPIYLLGFTWTTPHTCVTACLTLVLRGLSFDTFETNLLTVPAHVLFITQLVFWTWVSEKINNRYMIVLPCQIYMFPLLVGLEVVPAGAAYAWKRKRQIVGLYE